MSVKREDFSLIPETAPIYAEEVVLPSNTEVTELEPQQEDNYEDLDLPYVTLHRMYNSLCDQCEAELERYQKLDKKRVKILKDIEQLRENIARISSDESK